MNVCTGLACMYQEYHDIITAPFGTLSDNLHKIM